MRLISAIAYKWANNLADRLNSNHAKKRFYYYWFRLILGTLIKMLIVLGIAILLNVFPPTLYCVITYGIIKILSGGMHYRSFGRSILLSVMLFITMGVIADTFKFIYEPYNGVLTKGPYIYVWVMFIFSMLCAIFFVPVKVRQKVKHWNVLKYFYKVATILVVGYAMYYSLQIMSIEKLTLVISVWTAIPFELATAIPIVYFGVTKLNQILNYK